MSAATKAPWCESVAMAFGPFQPNPPIAGDHLVLNRLLPSQILAIILWAALVMFAPAVAATLTVVSFNVESDRDTSPHKVAQDIRAISAASAADLFGLAEVRGADDLAIYAEAAARKGADFRALLARNGGDDRVAILFNASALELRQVRELDRIPGSRKALVARFQHRTLATEFLFIVNHFNRRDTARRNRQALLIRDWVLAQDLPAILVGDYNFDYDPNKGRGNAAFEIFTEDPGLVWLQPPCIVAGTCPSTGTQCDDRFNSIMDFVLLAHQGRGWKGRSAILMQQPDYCERERRGYADHRPVLGVFEIR